MISPKELNILLEKARSNNERADLTGILLSRGRSFLQLLEGKRENVVATFEKIAKDSRHDSIEILFEAETPNGARLFPLWRMGSISNVQKNHEHEMLVSRLLEQARSGHADRSVILGILRQFSQVPQATAQDVLNANKGYRLG